MNVHSAADIRLCEIWAWPLMIQISTDIHVLACRRVCRHSGLARFFIALLLAALIPAAASAQAKGTTDFTVNPSDWYRYQGAADSGPCAYSNCGPATVAMAIAYARGESVPIQDIRTYMTGDSCRGIGYEDAVGALDHWQIGYQYVTGMEALKEAVRAREHIVLVILDMSFIRPGSDYLVGQSDRAQHFDRFHAYTDGHMIVVKGVTADNAWVVVDDPYVFDPVLGAYENGAPKGQDRYFRYAEFEQAYGVYGWLGIEITPAGKDAAGEQDVRAAARQALWR